MAVNIADTKLSPSIQCCNGHSTVAELWCNICEDGFCSKCYETVHTAPAMKSHHSIPISQKTSTTVSCETHSDEEFRYWCHDCEALFCYGCQMSNHKSHTMVAMNEIASGIKEAIRAGLERTQLFLDQNFTQVAQLMNASSDITNTTITKTFASLRAMIDEHEKTLQQQIRTITAKNKKLLEDYHNYLRSKQQMLHNQSNDFAHILSTNDHTKLLQAKKRLTDYLETITEELPVLKQSIKTEYRVDGIDRLQTSVNDILKPVRIIEQKGEFIRFAVSNNIPSLSQKPLDCSGNACRNCGSCRDWKHTNHNWYRAPDATCDDYRYWHYVIYRHPPTFQRGIGGRIIYHGFHHGFGGRNLIFDYPTHHGYHDLCECEK